MVRIVNLYRTAYDPNFDLKRIFRRGRVHLIPDTIGPDSQIRKHFNKVFRWKRGIFSGTKTANRYQAHLNQPVTVKFPEEITR